MQRGSGTATHSPSTKPVRDCKRFSQFMREDGLPMSLMEIEVAKADMEAEELMRNIEALLDGRHSRPPTRQSLCAV